MRAITFALVVCSVLISQVWAELPQMPKDFSSEDIEHFSTWTVGRESENMQMKWKLTADIPKGSWLRVRGSNMFCMSSFYADRITAGTQEIPIEHRYSREDLLKDWMYFVYNPYIAAGKTAADIVTGTEVVSDGPFQVRPVGSEGEATNAAGVQLFFCLEKAESFDGPWEQVSKWVLIQTEGAKASSIEASIRANGDVHIVYLDEYTNPSVPSKRTLTVTDMNGKALAETETEEKTWVRISAGDIKGKPLRVKVKDSEGLEVISSPRQDTSDRKIVCFGDLHWHTEYSGDAFRPIHQALRCARDEFGLDFTSLGDHYTFQPGYSIEKYHDTMDAYNEPGVFPTILGYEVSTGQGHFNPYFRDRKAAAKFDEHFMELYKAIPKSHIRLPLRMMSDHFETGEVIFIPHHTNTNSGEVTTDEGYAFWKRYDWSDTDDRIVRLAEMIQERSCFETEQLDEDWRVTRGERGSSLRTALTQGYRFGFVGSSDNHQGYPRRNQGKPGYSAAAAVIADELTREAIFDAMIARRTYATSGERIILEFTLNEKYPMGSEVKLPVGVKRNFKIRILGTDVLDRVEIISQNATIATVETNGTSDLETIWTDPRPTPPLDNCYYYLRVRQKNTHCAWSSPIWIDFDGE